jgi:hypothetical protein
VQSNAQSFGFAGDGPSLRTRCSRSLSPPVSRDAAYPMGLPEYDIIRAIIEDKEEIAGSAASADHLDPDSSELWCVQPSGRPPLLPGTWRGVWGVGVRWCGWEW